MAYHSNGGYEPNGGYHPNGGAYAPNQGAFNGVDPHQQDYSYNDSRPYDYGQSHTGVVDEKMYPVESEKGFHDKDMETAGRRPGYRGKDNEYTVEIAPAGQEQHVHDAVFGDMDNGPNYRAVGRGGAFVLMTKANIGLGVLSIPFVFMEVGMVPGVILLFVLALIVMYCACQIGDFKMNHPECYNLSDAGRIIGGRIGDWYFSAAFVLFMIFVSASGIVGVATSLNAVSLHATCTAVFVAVAAICGFLLCSVRTLGKISWLGWIGLISIMAAILTLTVSVGVQDRPYGAKRDGYPAPGPWPKDLKIFNAASFAMAMSAINSILFAYAATPTYFGIISEMRDPRTYKSTMCFSMICLWAIYSAIGIVVYYYCGQYVSSPALGSAGGVMKRICYGIAIPALLVTLCIYSHLAAKFFFVRFLRGSKHLTDGGKVHWTVWLGCCAAVIIIEYIIASAIPIFGDLISLIGALIGPSVTIIPYTLMWWNDKWRYESPMDRTTKRKLMLALNILLFFVGLYITGAGTYAAIVTIINDPDRTTPWSCADNSADKFDDPKYDNTPIKNRG